ncbi:MAG: mucoidy inhibitor MuiA family protein [Anaerolineae bacterium]|jgi:uncharacterized protein (TIGR02231 family)
MVELASRIMAVVVYGDRARVTRAGEVTLEPGKHRLKLPELPQALDLTSVRAAARGTPARLLGVDVGQEFYVETPEERVRQLERKIEERQDQLQALDARAALLKEQRASIRGLMEATDTFARGLAFGKVSPESHLQLMEHLGERADQVERSILEASVQRRDLEREVRKLQQELAQLRGARGRQRYAATIEIEVLEEGKLTVELTYVVANAGWTPLYDLRLVEDRLEVGYLAQVTQRSGEDWRDVALTLSTARPALAETVPELDPWFVQPLRPKPLRAPQPRMARAALSMEQEMAEPRSGAAPEAAVEPVDAAVVTAEVETRGASVTYRVPDPVYVPADGTSQKVQVAMVDLPPEIDYVSAPKLVEAAYRRAKVTNDSEYTFLSGVANLFDGDEFIGATELELTAPQGEFELYLGTDDRVRVGRELKRRDVDKRLIGNQRRYQYGYQIEVENQLAEAIEITLHDQIPVSRHEDIKIRLESTQPKPDEETELGLLRWELTLPPGEKKTVRFDFLVEHPRDMTVLGLE